jgi:hypothetical protein
MIIHFRRVTKKNSVKSTCFFTVIFDQLGLIDSNLRNNQRTLLTGIGRNARHCAGIGSKAHCSHRAGQLHYEHTYSVVRAA